MSSMWASTVASLDDSLAALDAVTKQFEAATPVDLPQAIERIKIAAESSRSLRTFVLSELPEADWHDRNELNALLQAIEVQYRRSQLLALAAELERGNIVHRRAARVTQLTELRTEAVEELRSLAAAEKAPPTLPGPAADRWMDWACSLQEPDDTPSLQSLREGFPWLDEFVAALEPGMWVVSTPLPQAPPRQATPVAASPVVAPPASVVAPPAPVVAPPAPVVVSATAAAAVAPVGLVSSGAAAAPAPAPVSVAVSTPPPEPVLESAFAVENDLEQRRSRLLALATDLERGSVVHNRAIRVTQVNQLRDQAIQELRFQAVVAREPAVLPGPEPEQWVQWACTLEEPDDAEALQILREGFVHLDEFVANLEPDMWVPAGPPVPVVAAAPPEMPAEPVRQEKPHAEVPAREKSPSVAKVKSAAAAAAFSRFLTSAKESASGLSTHVPPKLATFWHARWRIVLPAAVLLIVLLGAMQWQLHRTHASNTPVKTEEAKAPDTTEAAVPASTNTSTTPATPTTRPPEVKDKNANSKSQVNDNKPAPVPPPTPEKQVSVLNDSLLRTPQAMPKTARVEEGGTSAEAPGMVPGALPGTAPGNVTNIVKDVPVSSPKLPQQKLRVSSGVAQGQLIHEVQPSYPPQAKLAKIGGTVVLQVTVSKDGKVQNVKALRGPPILIQPAVDAVKQWRYKPFAVNGEASEAEVEINLNFAPQ
jgi:periplasmic protein TonB